MNDPRYARSGTFFIDVTVAYQSIASVSHSMRLTLIVGEVNDVKIVVSGTNDLSAKPGEAALFSISAKNVGNSQAQYSVDCQSQNSWQIMLGNSNSSSLDYEPLDIQSFLSMPVRVFIPEISSGMPAAGFQDIVQCFVTSSSDVTLNYTESVIVMVEEMLDYSTNLMRDSNEVGTNLEVRDVLIDSGELITLQYQISNHGNSEIILDVIIQQSKPSWFVELVTNSFSDDKELSVTIQAGQSTIVELNIASPNSALEGDFIMLNLKAELGDYDYKSNNTRIVIMDDLSINLDSPEKVVCQIGEDFSFTEFNITNTGNSIAYLNWSNSLPPNDGWIIGFANPVTVLEPRDWSIVRLGVIAPNNQEVSNSAFKISISVVAENDERSFNQSVILDVEVKESKYGNVTLNDDNQKPFIGIPKGDSQSAEIVLRNDGNTPLSGNLISTVVNSDGQKMSNWDVKTSPSNLNMLNPGDSVIIKIEVIPSVDSDKGPYQIYVNLTDGGDVIASINLQTSASKAEGNTGLFNILPWYISLLVIITGIVGVLIISRRIRSGGSFSDDQSEQIMADIYGAPSQSNNRREFALDIGNSQDDKTSGGVSQEEIAAALAQSMSSEFSQSNIPPIGNQPPTFPVLGNLSQSSPLPMPPQRLPSPTTLPQPNTMINPGAPPIPSTGLPPGWTIEQWNAYGYMWLEKNQQ